MTYVQRMLSNHINRANYTDEDPVIHNNKNIFREISTSGSVRLSECSVRDVSSGALVELIQSLVHSIQARGSIKASKCVLVGNIISLRGVELRDDSESMSIDANESVKVISSKVKGYIASGNTIFLGKNAEAKIATASYNLIIENSTIFERAEALEVQKCYGATISGWLICSNGTLHIINSKINFLLLRANKKVLVQIVGVEDSQVTEIIFERPGGIVKLKGSSTVSKIVNGTLLKF